MRRTVEEKEPGRKKPTYGVALPLSNPSPQTTKVMMSDPSIRFLPAEATTLGTCPRCRAKGPVNKFCFPCCQAEGQIIGTCPSCEEYGAIGTLCLECGQSKYQDEIPMGNCPICNGEGMRGTLCSNCEDQCMVYG